MTKVADAVAWLAREERILCGAFVVMPDHWHLLFSPIAAPDLSTAMRDLCHWLSRQTGRQLAARGCRWQDGYHDVRIRSMLQFRYFRRYIRDNPVKAGLVSCPMDWRWSSQHPDYAGVCVDRWPWPFEQDD